MDFQDVLACLEDPIKREEYIARLKSAAQNSQPVLNLKKSLEALNMHKPPKHIFQTTMLQHTFKFCDPLECFLQFRLVCKPWQNAVETIKFDKWNTLPIEQYANCSGFVTKFLPMFKKLKFYISHPNFEVEEIRNSLLHNVSNLTEVCFGYKFIEQDAFSAHDFMTKMYQNSRDTLKTINHYGKYFPNMNFPKATEVGFALYEETSNTFVQTIQMFSENMEHLKVVYINIDVVNEEHAQCFNEIGEKYSKHCISAIYENHFLLDYLPLKIYKAFNLTNLKDKKYNHQLEYISCQGIDLTDPSESGWDEYQDILDQCTKLKQISLADWDFENIDFTEDDITLFWKEMLAYLQKRGIQIVPDMNIHSRNLSEKVAKELGIKWRLEFE